MRIILCVLFLLCISPQLSAQIDTDGDGLLDLLDHPSFDPLLGGEVSFWDSGVEDLDGANQLTKATNLELSGHRITSVEAGDFWGLPNLQWLDLSDNLIANLEPSAFTGLPNLETLLLMGNSINSLETGAFDGLTNLQWLLLRWNPITSLEPGSFDGLTNLQHLDLDGNEITSVEEGGFEGLSSLQRLNLSANPISHLEARTFADLPNLKTLNLGWNQIANVEAGAFTDLANLQTLWMNGNQLTSLEHGTFDGLTNLQNLFLFRNQLTELNFGGASLDSLSLCEWDGRSEYPAIYISAKGFCTDQRETRLILDDAQLSLGSFNAIVSQASSITSVSLDGLSFTDPPPSDLNSLLGKEALKTVKVAPNLYDLYASEFDAFAAIDGKTITIVDPDCNGDGVLDILDANCTPGRRIKYFLEDYGTVPGDADGMGGVEFADFLILNSNFGLSPAAYTDGDFDMDGKVDFSDFLVLSGNFGQGDDFSSKLEAVPEPSSLLYLLLAMVGMVFQQRQIVEQ